MSQLRKLDSHRHVSLSSVVVDVGTHGNVGAFVLLVFILLALFLVLLSLDHVGTTGQRRDRLLRWRFSILAQLPVEVEHFLIAEELVACPDLVLAKLGGAALQEQADVRILKRQVLEVQIWEQLSTTYGEFKMLALLLRQFNFCYVNDAEVQRHQSVLVKLRDLQRCLCLA